jgi:hypothetical protein
MKKFLLTSVLALPFLALSQQDASAWTKFNFGVGANLGWSAGGNHCCWGLWNSEQPPAANPGFPVGGYGAPAAYPGFSGGGYGASGATFGGSFPFGASKGASQDISIESETEPSATMPPAPLPKGVKPAVWYNNGYQPVSYYQAPQYWYGE